MGMISELKNNYCSAIWVVMSMDERRHLQTQSEKAIADIGRYINEYNLSYAQKR